MTDAKQQKTLLAERDCIAKFDHRFVVDFYGAFQDRDFVYLAIEYASGGDLYSFMYEREAECAKFKGKLGGLNDKTARFYLACIILGLEHMHSHNVAWRDLKPENTLFDDVGYVKLSDFGFAKEFVHSDHEDGTTDDARTFTLCGTPDYLAPEIVLSQGHDKAVDFWALGVLAYELLYATTPFAHESQGELFQNILSASALVHEDAMWPGDCSPEARSFISELLHAQPSFRLGNLNGGYDAIKRHGFFAKVEEHDFAWPPLAAGDAVVLPPPYAPPKPLNPLAPTNFTPDADVEGYADTTYTGAQEVFDRWSELHNEHGTLFDADDLHMAK